MKYLVIIFFAISCSIGIAAQCPSNLNLSFSTQAQLDDFIDDYPNCTVVNSITIDGNDNGSVAPYHLSPLKRIKTVNGNFRIKSALNFVIYLVFII